jgi:hypothetical protein
MTTRTGALQPTYGNGGDPRTSPVITAEIPAVPAGPGYGVLLPDGSIWYPGSRKRLPAPLPLRVAVWTLAFLVLIAGAADLIIRTHPSWVDPLRRHINPALSTSLGGGTSGSRTSPGAGSSPAPSAVSLSRTSPQPSGMPGATTAYTVSGTSTFQVAVKASELTYMKAAHLVNGQDSGTPLYVGYVQPGHTETVTASGPVDVQVDAGGTTVSVLSGSKLVGTAATPPYVPWDFWFLPATKS